MNTDVTHAKGVLQIGRTLSVMPTYQCNASCANCGTFSNPKTKTHLSEAVMQAAINEAKELNFINVVFTGGEPTLRWQPLLRAIRHASSLGLLTRVVTNCYWAKSELTARNKLSTLLQSGLSEVNFSTGDQHVKFVPLENIINGILAAYVLNIKFFVNVEGSSDRSITRNDLLNHPRLSNIPNQILLKNIEESPWMPLSPLTMGAYKTDWYINKGNIGACKGCDSILQTIVLHANNKLTACCGLGTRDIPELHVETYETPQSLYKAISTAEEDLLKLALRYIGPEKILAWCATKDNSIEWENLYAHRCQFCMKIYNDQLVRKVLTNHIDELTLDVITAITFDEIAWPHHLQKSMAEIDQTQGETTNLGLHTQ